MLGISLTIGEIGGVGTHCSHLFTPKRAEKDGKGSSQPPSHPGKTGRKVIKLAETDGIINQQ